MGQHRGQRAEHYGRRLLRQQSWSPSGHPVVSGDAPPVTFGLAVIKLKTDGDRFRFQSCQPARAVIAVADLTWRM